MSISDERSQSERVWRVAWIPAGVSGLLSLVIFAESIYVAFIASPEFVSNYHFGSDVMWYYGGWAYQSKRAYAVSGAITAVLLGMSCAGFSRAALRRSGRAALVAAGCWVVLLVLRQWPRGDG